jgi:hypothetical protein
LRNGCVTVASRQKWRLANEPGFRERWNDYNASRQRNLRATDPEYRKKVNAKNAARMRRERSANPDLYNARNRAWKHANKDKVYADINARRAWKRGQRCTCCTYTTIQRVYLAARVLRAEVDHRKPLAIGGLHCRKNLQILSPAAHRLKTVRDNKRIRAYKEKLK